MRVDFLGLQAFVSIAERGSFQRAAAHLNVTQTALSHRMRKFEEYFGVKLMTRTTRQVTLTPVGLDLMPKAVRIMNDVQNSLAGLVEYGSVKQQHLTFGCVPTIAANFLPRLFCAFSADHPDVRIKVYDNTAAQLAAFVESGAAEFAITIISVNRSDMEVRPLLKEPFVLVAPENHPLAALASVSWVDLVNEPLIRISSQAGNRALIDDSLRNRTGELQWRYEVQHVSTAIRMVAAGCGHTIVPSLSSHIAETPGIVAVPLKNPGVSRTIGLIHKRGGELSPLALDLISRIRKELKLAKKPASRAAAA